MKFTYKPSGVCSASIDIDIENNIVNSVKFHGGCSGNSQGVSALVKGRTTDDVIERLSGIKCGFKQTSCPDQLARALKELKSKAGD